MGRQGGRRFIRRPPLAALAAKSDQGSEWIVRLYPGNRRAGGFSYTGIGTRSIPPPVPLNTKRYQPKQWQALFRTNLIAIAPTMGFQRDESLWAYPLAISFHPASIEDRKTILASGSEWIVRLYTDNRRAGGFSYTGIGTRTIPPPVPLNTKRYQLKQRQALFRTNLIAIASTMGFQRDESLWAYPLATSFHPASIQDRKTILASGSEWIVRLYPGNRRAGGFSYTGIGTRTIPPSVPLNTKRYQPKQWQALFRTNLIAVASTMGFQRDKSLWA